MAGTPKELQLGYCDNHRFTRHTEKEGCVNWYREEYHQRQKSARQAFLAGARELVRLGREIPDLPESVRCALEEIELELQEIDRCQKT